MKGSILKASQEWQENEIFVNIIEHGVPLFILPLLNCEIILCTHLLDVRYVYKIMLVGMDF